jgi:proteasome lid subunit RPN8/RPN11
MDPVEVLAAFRDLDANGWTLGAIVHSHPATPPMPSPTDLREAFYPEALMLIVSFAAVPPVMRAWRLAAASPPLVAAEVPIVLSEGM